MRHLEAVFGRVHRITRRCEEAGRSPGRPVVAPGAGAPPVGAKFGGGTDESGEVRGPWGMTSPATLLDPTLSPPSSPARDASVRPSRRAVVAGHALGGVAALLLAFDVTLG